MTTAELRRLSELRSVLEGFAARHAATHAATSPDKLKQLHCPLKLTHVASKIAFTSPGNLSRLFRQQHGLSFQAYLQRLRLEKAAELLRTTKLPIARIAKRVVARFGQHFKRMSGETPRNYRRAGAQ